MVVSEMSYEELESSFQKAVLAQAEQLRLHGLPLKYNGGIYSRVYYVLLPLKKLWLHKLNLRLIVTASVCAALMCWFGYSLLPRSVQLNFARTTACTFAPALLPPSQPSLNNGYSVYRSDSIGIAKHSLFSLYLCASPISAPRPNYSTKINYTIGFAGIGWHKTLEIRTAGLPSLSLRPISHYENILPFKGTIYF